MKPARDPRSERAPGPTERRSAPGGAPATLWLPLLQEALMHRGSFVLPLRGDSMRPTLPSQCDIEIVPLVGPPSVGQLIVFVTGDALVAHRLVRRAGLFWIAQGDNRLGPDRTLRLEDMLGQVLAARVDGRQVWPEHLERILTPAWLARYQLLRAVRSLYLCARRALRVDR